jgi:hypothetical protein
MRPTIPAAFGVRPKAATESLAMVSLLGVEKNQTTRIVEAAQCKLLQFDRVVFVITSNDLIGSTRRGAVVETLPGPLEVVNKTEESISRYIAARFDQIQRKWQPDYMLQYGLDIEDYIRVLVEATRSPDDQSF